MGSIPGNHVTRRFLRFGITHMSTILLGLRPEELSRDALERIQAIQPAARLVITAESREIEPILEDIEIAAAHFPIQMILRAPNLRWFQQWGAGTDWLMRYPDIAGRDFILTNASGVHSIPISEHILSYLLAFSRGLPKAIRVQEQGKWLAEVPSFELSGKTLLLIGVGAIGRRTAQLASALGMHVIGVRRNPDQVYPGIQRMVGTQDLDRYLPEADFVVLTVPLTPETQGLINAATLAKMKPSAYLINIGRGQTIDEPALISALQNGQIAGAGLDVFTTEPLPPDSPFWKMENVIITPHSSGSTPYYNERALNIFIDNLERYTQGKPMKNVVDKKRGY
jgi:phosphoglycerate dehydrogenase-like enzyme